jgi:hypothetical protein
MDIQKAIEKKQVEDRFRSEFEATLKERIDRHLESKPHSIIALTHFAGVSTECSSLYRDGHYYGCIALCQAVAEALVRFMCSCNSFRPAKVFETNVNNLAKRGFIKDEIKEYLLSLWQRRDDYHHLNPGIEEDRIALQELALAKIRLLTEVESNVFAYSIVDGALNPANPKYWVQKGNYAQVFLRLEP